MQLISWIGLIIISLTWGAQLYSRSLLVKAINYIFAVSIAGVFGVLTYWSHLQYATWSISKLEQFFLPPHESIWYFIFYIGTRLFIFPSLIALFAALFFLWFTRLINKKFNERYFEPEEPLLIALCVFLSGYPGFLFFFLVFFVAYLLLQIAFNIHPHTSYLIPHTSSYRTPAYYLWLPSAILAIIVVYWLLPQEIVGQFNL